MSLGGGVAYGSVFFFKEAHGKIRVKLFFVCPPEFHLRYDRRRTSLCRYIRSSQLALVPDTNERMKVSGVVCFMAAAGAANAFGEGIQYEPLFFFTPVQTH